MSNKIKVILAVRPLWLLVGAVAVAFAAGIIMPMAPGVRGPLVDINDGILIAILVSLGGFVAQLYLRMGKLETDLRSFREDNDGLRADLTDAASFINRVGLWVAKGSKGPIPQPSERLSKHVDAELWAEEPVAIGGTTD